jgi:hypothetical protein
MDSTRNAPRKPYDEVADALDAIETAAIAQRTELAALGDSSDLGRKILVGYYTEIDTAAHYAVAAMFVEAGWTEDEFWNEHARRIVARVAAA